MQITVCCKTFCFIIIIIKKILMNFLKRIALKIIIDGYFSCYELRTYVKPRTQNL